MPTLIKPIPAQITNEMAAYGPFDLKAFISPTTGAPHFLAELSDGGSLPNGLICTEDGLLTGIPAKDTHGNYVIKIIATENTESLEAELVLTIKPSLAEDDTRYFDQLKAQVWEALDQNLPPPDFGAMMEEAINPLEIDYLLERWAVIIIWDAFNLDPAQGRKPLSIPGVSPLYQVYDRGSSIVATPKDLFDHKRTIADGLQTARALAQEVYKRGWTIEMAGYGKLTRAVWVELQHLGDQHGNRLEIINFTPTADLIEIYRTQAIERPRNFPEQS